MVLGGLAGVKALQFKKLMAKGSDYAEPPESVSSALVRAEKWQGALAAIGSVTAVAASLSPEIAGIIHEITWNWGPRCRRATCWCAWTRPWRRRG